MTDMPTHSRSDLTGAMPLERNVCRARPGSGQISCVCGSPVNRPTYD